MSSDLIELVTLYERTSKNGVIYLVGRLGSAKILLMPGDTTQEGQRTFRLLLAQAAPKSTVTKPQPSQSRPRSQARSVTRRPAAPRASGPTLANDPVDDLWRDGLGP